MFQAFLLVSMLVSRDDTPCACVLWLSPIQPTEKKPKITPTVASNLAKWQYNATFAALVPHPQSTSTSTEALEPTHLENMRKSSWDHFPRERDEHKKCLKPRAQYIKVAGGSRNLLLDWLPYHRDYFKGPTKISSDLGNKNRNNTSLSGSRRQLPLTPHAPL